MLTDMIYYKIIHPNLVQFATVIFTAGGVAWVDFVVTKNIYGLSNSSFVRYILICSNKVPVDRYLLIRSAFL